MLWHYFISSFVVEVALFCEFMIANMYLLTEKLFGLFICIFREICNLTVECLNLYLDVGRQRVHAQNTGMKGGTQGVIIRQTPPITADMVAIGGRSPGPKAR